MNKRRFLRLIVLISCLLTVWPTIAQNTSDGIPDKSHALNFFHRVQTVLKAGRPDQVALLVHYPLRTTIDGKSRLVYSKAEFIRAYDLIFTPARVKAIVTCEDDDVWYRDLGYSIPYGVIWFNDSAPPKQSASKYEITTVNAAKEEAR